MDDFTIFIETVKKELTSESLSLVIQDKFNIALGILQLSLQSTDSCIGLLLKGDNNARFWKIKLDCTVIKQHLEEELGLYDSNGVHSFASHFATAIQKGVIVDHPNEQSLNIILSYSTFDPTMVLEGKFMMKLIQDNISLDLFDMYIKSLQSDSKVMTVPYLTTSPPKSITSDITNTCTVEDQIISSSGSSSSSSKSSMSQPTPTMSGKSTNTVSTASVAKPSTTKKRKMGGGGTSLFISRYKML